MTINSLTRRAGAALILLLGAGLLLAAESLSMGTVEHAALDDGTITISGKIYNYSDGITQVFLDAKPLAAHHLDVGIVVRYSIDGDGMLLRIEVLGPAEKLRLLNQH